MQQSNLEIIGPLLLIPILLTLLWRLGVKRLKSCNSPFLGKIEVLQKYNGEKVLTIKHCPQGVSINNKSINKSYWFAVSQLVVNFCKSRRSPQVLMLGLGAATIPNLIAKFNPQIHQTIVEIDPQIVQACKDFFGLDSLPNHTLKMADVYKLANNKTAFGKKFDVLIIDVYTGDPPYVSLKSNEPHFIEKILPWLRKNGLIIFNRPGHTESAHSDSQSLKDYLDTLFIKTSMTTVKDPRGYQNNIVVATELK